MKNIISIIAIPILCAMLAFSIYKVVESEEMLSVSKSKLEKELIIISEKAYFEGQKDAINGDIKIKLNSDSIYIWTESCWDDKRSPIYVPTYIDSKKDE